MGGDGDGVSEKGKVPMADGPSVADTEGREDRRRRKKKRTGKMGSQLFFRLACIVPLAITRLERNVFSWPFPGLTHL